MDRCPQQDERTYRPPFIVRNKLKSVSQSSKLRAMKKKVSMMFIKIARISVPMPTLLQY